MQTRFLSIAGALLALAALQPYRPFLVSGTSMAPAFKDGQLIVGDLRKTNFKRGDVVIFHRQGETVVKRVALLPGDRVERYFFADEWRYPLTEKMRRALIRNAPREQIAIPTGQIFVTGDNVNESVDSRTYGSIAIADVVAVVRSAPPDLGQYLVGIHKGTARIALR